MTPDPINDPGQWLLILGAGASAPSPSALPAFSPLAQGVLQAMGWERREGNPRLGVSGAPATTDDLWVVRTRAPDYPPFPWPSLWPEVLFGTLRGFGITFAGPVSRALSPGSPNAVHRVAADVLSAGGCVWTTNVDRKVEEGCTFIGLDPPRAGRATTDAAKQLFVPLGDAGPGTLVKFHGTIEAPETLAFTDRELMTPLPQDEVEHLRELAASRAVVIFGYAGVDADLADLLETIFDDAPVTWFEPFQSSRTDITRAFPDAQITFLPEPLPVDVPKAIHANGEAFLALIEAAGLDPGSEAKRDLLAPTPTEAMSPPDLQIAEPPGISQVRLLERFGDPASELEAVKIARREDWRGLRVRTISKHLAWSMSRSLYHQGFVSKAVMWVTRRRQLTHHLQPARLRNRVIDAGRALRLSDGGDWADLALFADWATQERAQREGQPRPSDLYYRAHARRYGGRLGEARGDAEQAIDGLGNLKDPERLAGALLDAGCIAIYQGRFEEARRYAFELQFRRGHYAIARWRCWGIWLDAVALCHLGLPDEIDEKDLVKAEDRFEKEGRLGALADMRAVRLLRARVWMALGEPLDEAILVDPADSARQRRYGDDLDLLFADIALARNDIAEARERLARVAADPSCPVAAPAAHLGLAEMTRLEGGRVEAGRAFAALAADGHERGATWLEAQAVIGMTMCQDPDADAAWRRLRPGLSSSRVAQDPMELVLGPPHAPRVLWMMTV